MNISPPFLQIKQDVKTSNCSQLMSLYDSYSTKVSETRGRRRWRWSDGLCAQPRPWSSILSTECLLPTAKTVVSLKPPSNPAKASLHARPSNPSLHLCCPSAQAYLVKEGKLSKGATEMIGDLLNEDPGYHKSLLESLRSPNTFSRTDE